MDAERKRNEQSFCKIIQISSSTSSIVCQVGELEREIYYGIQMYSTGLGLIDTNTSVIMQVHQREQLKFELVPSSLVAFLNESDSSTLELSQFNFRLDLQNPNRLGQVPANLSRPAEKWYQSFSHCLLEGIETDIQPVYSNIYDVVTFQCDFTA